MERSGAKTYLLLTFFRGKDPETFERLRSTLYKEICDATEADTIAKAV